MNTRNSLKIYFDSCVCVGLYECMPHMCGTWGGQRQTSDLLELELQMVVTHSMWVLGTDLEALKEQLLLFNF